MTDKFLKINAYYDKDYHRTFHNTEYQLKKGVNSHILSKLDREAYFHRISREEYLKKLIVEIYYPYPYVRIGLDSHYVGPNDLNVQIGTIINENPYISPIWRSDYVRLAYSDSKNVYGYIPCVYWFNNESKCHPFILYVEDGCCGDLKIYEFEITHKFNSEDEMYHYLIDKWIMNDTFEKHYDYSCFDSNIITNGGNFMKNIFKLFRTVLVLIGLTFIISPNTLIPYRTKTIETTKSTYEWIKEVHTDYNKDIIKLSDEWDTYTPELQRKIWNKLTLSNKQTLIICVRHNRNMQKYVDQFENEFYNKKW